MKNCKKDKHYVIGQIEGVIEAAEIMKPELVSILKEIKQNVKNIFFGSNSNPEPGEAK